MRLLEASHVVEILREARPDGLHVDSISEKNSVKATKLAHILRLLATHHILHELLPDVFVLNRISSLVDSGKTVAELKAYQEDGIPEMKYRDMNGVAAFVGLCTDEIQKASTYMTETYYLSPSPHTRAGTEPGRALFCFAFDTVRSGTGFFGWLEGEVAAEEGRRDDDDTDDAVERGRGGILLLTLGPSSSSSKRSESQRKKGKEDPRLQPRATHTKLPSSGEGAAGNCARTLRKKSTSSGSSSAGSGSGSNSTSTIKNGERSEFKFDSNENTSAQENVKENANRFRLARFGKAMSGTD
ncbi:LOW QUALITY PROTEIN: hypothetical protein CVT25_014790, partial [Psilocybe cyanescens]